MALNSPKYQTAIELLINYINQLVIDKNLSLDELANKSGLSTNHIQRLLSGRYQPSLEVFLALCDAADAYLFIIDKDADSDLVEMMQNRWGNIGEN